MCMHEAEARARRVWGRDRVINVTPHAQGGYWVNLREDHTVRRGRPSQLFERAHVLDEAGRPICHSACMALEGVPQ
jgi:hypothetical protein